MRISIKIAFAAAFGSCLWPPAFAADKRCTLVKVVELPLTVGPNGGLIMPVKFGDRAAQMYLDTGAFWSIVGLDTVNGQPLRTARVGAVDAAGNADSTFIKVPDFMLGSLKIADVDFYVHQSLDMTIAGNLGMNVLGMGDIEIDPSHNRAAIFSKDHCPDQVVYWAHGTATRLPMEIGQDHRLYVSVTLDGRQHKALIDTGAGDSVVAADAVPSTAPDGTAGDTKLALQTLSKSLDVTGRQFDTLTLGDIKFRHPWIAVAPNKPNNGSDFVLGMHQLRRLHIYLDVQDSALYATTDPDEASPAPSLGSGAVPAALAPPGGSVAVAAAPPSGAPGSDATVADNLDYARIKAYAERGVADMQHQQPEQAIAEYDAALAQVPNAPHILVLRGIAYIREHEMAKAFNDLNSALAAQPQLPDGYASRSLAYSVMGDFPRAIADANYVAALYPHSAEWLGAAGWYLLLAQRPQAALSDLDAALELKPKDTQIKLWRALALAHLHQDSLALAECDQVATLAPKSALPNICRGFANIDLGDTDAAARDFDAALTVLPNAVTAIYGRALVLRRRGDTAGALAEFAAAKQVDPYIELGYGFP